MLKKAVVLSIFVETVIHFFNSNFFTSPPEKKVVDKYYSVLKCITTQYTD